MCTYSGYIFANKVLRSTCRWGLLCCWCNIANPSLTSPSINRLHVIMPSCASLRKNCSSFYPFLALEDQAMLWLSLWWFTFSKYHVPVPQSVSSIQEYIRRLSHVPAHRVSPFEAESTVLAASIHPTQLHATSFPHTLLSLIHMQMTRYWPRIHNNFIEAESSPQKMVIPASNLPTQKDFYPAFTHSTKDSSHLVCKVYSHYPTLQPR